MGAGVRGVHGYNLLLCCLQSYYDEMDSGAENSIPLRLRGKRDIIFGNLLDIYMFHDE